MAALVARDGTARHTSASDIRLAHPPRLAPAFISLGDVLTLYNQTTLKYHFVGAVASTHLIIATHVHCPDR